VGLAVADSDIVLVDLLVREMERTASEIRDAGRQVMMFEADVVVFPATSEPCFITGQTFTVRGFHYNC
jgi:3-oxoacyl-[acyl-carrier protein] reductase